MATRKVLPRGNGVMDCTLACCAGGLGSIPAVSKSNVQYSDGFSSSQCKVVGEINEARYYLRDLASPCSIKIIILLLATPSMVKHN